jgi:hypothetical protein
MFDLPQFAISDRHARGLRRHIERRIRDRQQNLKVSRNPQKFGPRVRMVHDLLVAALGPGRVMMVEDSKKLAMWTCCELNADGMYQLRGESLRKRSGDILSEVQEYPLLATPHFFERLIQGFRLEGHTLITTMIDVIRLLMDEVGIDETASEGRWPTWRVHGNAWFALEYGLAAGDVPQYGEVVLRTIIPVASLHPARREAWEAMRSAGRPVSVSKANRSALSLETEQAQ